MQHFINFLKQQLPGKCDQQCTNLNGSYECGCEDGYNLKPDGHSCKAYNRPKNEPPSLLFANSLNVKQVDLDTVDPSQDVNVKGTFF